MVARAARALPRTHERLVPQERMAEYIRASLSTDRLQIDPGESAEAVISIQNVSNVVDVFSVEVDGLEASWHRLSANSVSLFPGDSSSLTLTISVPRSSGAVAKAYPFAVKVAARKAPSESVSLPCELVVTPFYTYEASIRPQRVSGAVGQYDVTLTNNSNTELSFFLEGSDPENLCRFSFEPRSPAVAPAARQEVRVIVEPGQRPFRGTPKLYGMEIRAVPPRGTAEPKTLRAELEATPRLPKWAIPAAIGGAVLLAALIVLLVVLLPGGASLDTEFFLNPGQEITYGFTLPELEPLRLQVRAEWEGNSDTLDVTLERPNGVRFSTLQLTRSEPEARFFLTQEDVALGAEGWKLVLRNTSGRAQVEGRLGVEHSRLE